MPPRSPATSTRRISSCCLSCHDQGGSPRLPTLERLHVSMPVLSLHGDDKVVYLMTKVGCYDMDAWVIAVDMDTKTVQGVARFLPGKLVDCAYVHSRISNYLNVDTTS